MSKIRLHRGVQKYYPKVPRSHLGRSPKLCYQRGSVDGRRVVARSPRCPSRILPRPPRGLLLLPHSVLAAPFGQDAHLTELASHWHSPMPTVHPQVGPPIRHLDQSLHCGLFGAPQAAALSPQSEYPSLSSPWIDLSSEYPSHSGEHRNPPSSQPY